MLGRGVVYGVTLWLIGSELLMPARLGMPVMQMGMTGMQKLMAHRILGAITALDLWRLRRRAAR